MSRSQAHKRRSLSWLVPADIDSDAEETAAADMDDMDAGSGDEGAADNLMESDHAHASAASVPSAPAFSMAPPAAAPEEHLGDVARLHRQRNLEQALIIQMDMQKKLHEQLEVGQRPGLRWFRLESSGCACAGGCEAGAGGGGWPVSGCAPRCWAIVESGLRVGHA